jgi:cytochrome b6-f complex iron-sulfur subunit
MKSRSQKPTQKINRRAFLKALAASGGAAAYGSILASCGAAPASGGGGGGAEVTLDLNQPSNHSLAAAGGALVLEANAVDPKGLLLYRSSETAVSAFSRKCTHMGCAVGEFQNGLASCPCHGSQYDTGGKVVKGPAQSSLKEYPATLSGSTLTIRG